jgi:hypothetical protein
LVFAGLWLGCVLTEATFERMMLAKGRDHQLTLALPHWRVDVLVEIPASDWNGFERIDRRQRKVGALVLIGILGALTIGLFPAGQGLWK